MNAAKIQVRRAFGRAADDYDAAAEFQRATGRRLLANLPFDMSPPRILDSGCGTGHGLSLLRARWPAARVLPLDFALAMVRQLRRGAERLCGDAEALPLAARSIDFYWSNLTLQWCDTAAFLREAARVMTPGAKLALSTLGPATFNELRSAFSGVDSYRHTIDFCDEAGLMSAFADAGLRVHRVERIASVSHYQDISALLAAVRKLGANRVTGANRRHGLMGKARWMRFVERYEMLRAAQGLPLSYDTMLVYAEK